MQREFTRIAYALLFSHQSDCDTHTRQRMLYFFMFTLKKYFKFKVLYVLKTHLDRFNSQVNNLDDMEREQLDIKQN